MRTAIIEASNGFNWGKFLVGQFDGEWQRRPVFREEAERTRGMPLLSVIGWTHDHLLVVDLQTGEGAVFLARPGGYPKADLQKHRIHVCPLFEPFLEWLYQQRRLDRPDNVGSLPASVVLPEAPAALRGYRRPGQDCCSGINGSHTGSCETNQGEDLTCWCCGGIFPAEWACLWSPKGSRCFGCEGHSFHADGCRASVGRRLEGNLHGADRLAKEERYGVRGSSETP